MVRKEKLPVCVVLSAMSGTTNALVSIANLYFKQDATKALKEIKILEKKYEATCMELFGSPETREKAISQVRGHFDFMRTFSIDVFTSNEEKAILAQGELLSTFLFHLHLTEAGDRSVLLSALDFMRLDLQEEPDFTFIKAQISLLLKRNKGFKYYITQGYICRNSFGEIDNLKRGGSDYTASLLGAAINAEEIQIWTDIDGMHNNDPRVVKKTKPIGELSFDEAAELAYFGAKILHPTCILPARKSNVPVKLLNTLDPNAKGTLIKARGKGKGIKAVAAKDGIIAINIKSDRMLLAYGFLRSVFEVFERHKTPIDMITTSEVAVSLTIDSNKFLGDIVKELSNFSSVTVEEKQSIICIVGKVDFNKCGYASKVFQALKNIPVRMISYGGSENNISVLVHSSFKNRALQALNKNIFKF